MTGCSKCGVSHARGSPDCPGAREGQVLGDKYRLLRLLGQGGMGAVYEAEKVASSSKVAIKVLLGPTSLQPRFEQEARQLAKLAHPGIVAVTEVGTDKDGRPFLEMELLDGESVAKMIEKGPLPPEVVARYAKDALEALSAAHASGIVHRDVKPENLFVAKNGAAERVKLLDFGISKAGVEVAADAGLTMTGLVMGTPAYMSPEQAGDSKAVDVRTDVYSLGATMYAMLSGKPPVAAGALPVALHKVVMGNVERDPRTVRSDVPAWLAEIVIRAMSRDREQRFASADEMKRAIEAGLSGATAAPAVVETKPEAPSSSTVAASAATPQPVSQKTLIAGAVVVIVLLGIVFLRAFGCGT